MPGLRADRQPSLPKSWRRRRNLRPGELEAARARGLRASAGARRNSISWLGAPQLPRVYAEFAGAPMCGHNCSPNYSPISTQRARELRAKRPLERLPTRRCPRSVLVAATRPISTVCGGGRAAAIAAQAHPFPHEKPARRLALQDVRGFLVLSTENRDRSIRDLRMRLVRALPRTRQRELQVGIYFCPSPRCQLTGHCSSTCPAFTKSMGRLSRSRRLCRRGLRLIRGHICHIPVSAPSSQMSANGISAARRMWMICSRGLNPIAPSLWWL
jgi:hypothetical protein